MDFLKNLFGIKTNPKIQMVFYKDDGTPMTEPIVFKGEICIPDGNGCVRFVVKDFLDDKIIESFNEK